MNQIRRPARSRPVASRANSWRDTEFSKESGVRLSIAEGGRKAPEVSQCVFRTPPLRQLLVQFRRLETERLQLPATPLCGSPGSLAAFANNTVAHRGPSPSTENPPICSGATDSLTGSTPSQSAYSAEARTDRGRDCGPSSDGASGNITVNLGRLPLTPSRSLAFIRASLLKFALSARRPTSPSTARIAHVAESQTLTSFPPLPLHSPQLLWERPGATGRLPVISNTVELSCIYLKLWNNLVENSLSDPENAERGCNFCVANIPLCITGEFIIPSAI